MSIADMELEIARNTLGTREASLGLLRTQLQGGVGTLLDVRSSGGPSLIFLASTSQGWDCDHAR
jgi:hypothetical protein